MAERVAKRKLTKNDVPIGCPLCMVPKAPARGGTATTQANPQQ
jgi:hypothetical protein